MHGLGNDFVVFDAREQPIFVSHAKARVIADRRLGVGCDQVIVIENSVNGADARMRIFNADGGEVESCGNAARCVARLLIEENGASSIRLETEGGALSCADADGLVTIDMGAPRFGWRDIPFVEERDTNSFDLTFANSKSPAVKEAAAVNIGNPHCVLFVEDVEHMPIDALGPEIEHHPLFPQRTNVEFVQVLSPELLRMRVWERGAGITLACGTGACAAMVTARRRDLCGTKVEMLLDGGPLVIEWQGGDSHVFMTGPTALSFRGEIDLEALA